MRSFFDTVAEQLQASPGFRRAMLTEIVRLMFSDDLPTAKDMLQEYIKGTIGFAALGEGLGRSPASLKRMLASASKTKADDLFKIIHCLQKTQGITVTVKVTRATSQVDAAA